MALSWQIHVTFMGISQTLPHVENYIQYIHYFHSDTYYFSKTSIYFCMLYLFHFHGSFMALSWQIHVTFISDSLQLSNYHNSLNHIHISFMADSCHFHATFMADSCYFQVAFSKFEIVRLHYIIFKALLW